MTIARVRVTIAQVRVELGRYMTIPSAKGHNIRPRRVLEHSKNYPL